MRHSIVWLVGLILATSGPIVLGATLADVPMDAQINYGDTYNSQSPTGDAVYVPSTLNGSLSFLADEPEGYARNNYN